MYFNKKNGKNNVSAYELYYERILCKHLKRKKNKCCGYLLSKD